MGWFIDRNLSMIWQMHDLQEEIERRTGAQRPDPSLPRRFSRKSLRHWNQA
jgi:hypothetical protein